MTRNMALDDVATDVLELTTLDDVVDVSVPAPPQLPQSNNRAVAELIVLILNFFIGHTVVMVAYRKLNSRRKG